MVKNKIFLGLNIIFLIANLGLLLFTIKYYNACKKTVIETPSNISYSSNPSDIGEYPFPVDEYGYPKSVIIINDKEYKLNTAERNIEPDIIPTPTVIEVDWQEKIKIVIPDHNFYPYDWENEKTDGISAINFTAHYNEIKNDEVLEGGSDGLRVFEIIAEEDAKEIVLNYIVTSEDDESYRAINQRVIIKLKTE